jgi:cell division septum initiation protein DivIVA
MTTPLNKKLLKEIEELKREIQQLEDQVNLHKQSETHWRNSAHETAQELHTIKELAAELCKEAILLGNYPTLAKQLKLTTPDNAVNEYLRYIIGV